MNQLVREFQKLAEDLVNSNYVLYCYIPVGANGRVGWTFAEEKTVKERKPVKLWLGVGVEFGDSYDYDNEYHEFYKGLILWTTRVEVSVSMVYIMQWILWRYLRSPYRHRLLHPRG